MYESRKESTRGHKIRMMLTVVVITNALQWWRAEEDTTGVDSGGGDQLVANTVQNGRQKRTQDKDDVDRSGGDPHS